MKRNIFKPMKENNGTTQKLKSLLKKCGVNYYSTVSDKKVLSIW